MATLAELEAFREKLLRARFAGVRTVTTDTESVTWATDSEMRTALADVERRIAAASGQGRPSSVRLTVNKGL